MSQQILSTYFGEIARIRATGAGTGEISYYGALTTAINAVGATLKPAVFCVPNLRNRDRVGFPDMGLFAGNSTTSEGWPEGRPPERGVVEVDDIPAPLTLKLGSNQVARYLGQYGLVLVTNFREFVLLGKTQNGGQEVRERFTFGCATAETFFALCETIPRSRALATRFAEFLERLLLHQAPLARPEDVAFFLASYARDALARIETHANLPAFDSLRDALQAALGLQFDPPKGEHLFRSTLVQTLFYGLFSAWVEVARSGEQFDWHAAGWNLHVPFISELFQRIATPQQLRPLGLEEPLTWAAAALERVDRAAFFARFDDTDAVRYFYEPFLSAFDPDLRKALGVWYTPPEIVRYMVERVDQVLRTELGLPDGLADPDVWVLDPCCGTGAYLVAVLDRIERTLRENGEGALAGAELKLAAMTRVAGFEIMPAPYVIAHWQIGHTLRAANAPLTEGERAAVYLTNALTGWLAAEEDIIPDHAQAAWRFNFPLLANERTAATRVKREQPILVVIGNPPYNAFAGTSPAEEAGLVDVYKHGLQTEWRIRKFNLDDLYVRFFRLAERRIAESTGRGIVCFISNHSWLRYPSFVVMRRRLLASFDRVWIDNLNGSKFETGKLTPDGAPDPSIFSTDANREGIQVGTAIALLVCKGDRGAVNALYRDYWGTRKREDLLDSLMADDFDADYQSSSPSVSNKYSLRPTDGTQEYGSWPKINELAYSQPLNGLMEKRGGTLIDDDRARLERRMRTYFNAALPWNAIISELGPLSKNASRYPAEKTRAKLLTKTHFQNSAVTRYFVRPFDVRWAYVALDRPLWNEPRPELLRIFPGSSGFLITRPFGIANPEGIPVTWTTELGDNDAIKGHAYYCVASRQNDAILEVNLSAATQVWLKNIGLEQLNIDQSVANLVWHHTLAIAYAPDWLAENEDDIREDWPRIPLPSSLDLLRKSAAIGSRVALLLDPNLPVPGVVGPGPIAPELAAIALPWRQGNSNMSDADRAITAGWGSGGNGRAVMPGRGEFIKRTYDAAESSTDEFSSLLGRETYDIYLNQDACWRNIPEEVWSFTIGGYQVLKKWLSYREFSILGRSLTPGEVRYVRDVARRLAALRLLGPELDANYRACAATHTPLSQVPDAE